MTEFLLFQMPRSCADLARVFARTRAINSVTLLVRHNYPLPPHFYYFCCFISPFLFPFDSMATLNTVWHATSLSCFVVSGADWPADCGHLPPLRGGWACQHNGEKFPRSIIIRARSFENFVYQVL